MASRQDNLIRLSRTGLRRRMKSTPRRGYVRPTSAYGEKLGGVHTAVLARASAWAVGLGGSVNITLGAADSQGNNLAVGASGA